MESYNASLAAHPRYKNESRNVIEKTFSATTQRDQFKLSQRFGFN